MKTPLRNGPRRQTRWLLLAGIFLFMSWDSPNMQMWIVCATVAVATASIHERLER